MNKELIDRVWKYYLPKEFKEEVKERFTMFVNEKNPSDCSYGYIGLLIKLFGVHNLTSDAEGEEMLCVPRKDIVELYQEVQKTISQCKGTELATQAIGIRSVIWSFFGSKCMPDETCNVASSNVGSNVARSELRPTEEDDPDLAQRLAFLNSLSNEHSEPKPAEPKYHRGEKVCYNGYVYEIEGLVGKKRYALKGLNFDLDEDMIEPYIKPEENIAGNRNLSQDCDKEFDNILKNSFSKERRLNVAAMAMQGILSNESRMKQYEAMAASKPYEKLTDVVARNALRYADAIMNQAGE